jgi:triphosphoribosyl-dephospho-CoA synthetase
MVQAYLEPETSLPEPFGERAIALVRSYKQDLDRNRPALRELERELARRNYRLSEVRILDVLIWTVMAAAD